MTLVYWLFDASCSDPWTQGYVGVTVDLRNRLKWHRSKRGVFEHRVLYEGSEQECYALEAAMRPDAFMGWNEAFGGEGGGRQPKSPEHRQKLKEAALRRYADPVERMKMSEIQKGRKVTWGAKIAAGKQGLKPSDATRAKMSATRRGRSLGPQSEEHRAKLGAAKAGRKMPWVAESNRRRAEQRAEVSP